jgi:putative hydrolase of the HAD superfamily
MYQYIARFLNGTHEEAFRVQKDYYKRYGTTMRGLMTEHGLKPDDFLDFVHQIDHSPLEPNPALGAALAKLARRRLILPDGTCKHADGDAAACGSPHQGIFDIVRELSQTFTADLRGSPQPRR